MRTSRLEIRVGYFTDPRVEEYPDYFYIGNRRHVVLDDLDLWHGADYRYFKLRADDGGIYILRYCENDNVWELNFYDSGLLKEVSLSSTERLDF